jgi:hypothetical protein
MKEGFPATSLNLTDTSSGFFNCNNARMSLGNFTMTNEKGYAYYGNGINYLNVTKIVNKRGLHAGFMYSFGGESYASFLSLLLFFR